MKFFTNDGEIATVRANQATAHKCYNVSLQVAKKKKENKEEAPSKVMLVDLDARQREARRPKPNGELKVVQIGNELGQTTRINKALLNSLKQDLVALLKSNANQFT